MRPEEISPIEELLKRRIDHDAPAGGPLCGDPELFAAYVEDALDNLTRESFMTHLAVCNPCREAVVRLVRMTPREAVVTAAAPSAPVPFWKKWMWVPALASVVVVGSVVWVNRPNAYQQTIHEPPTAPGPAIVQNGPADARSKVEQSPATPAPPEDRKHTEAKPQAHVAPRGEPAFAPAPEMAKNKDTFKNEKATAAKLDAEEQKTADGALRKDAFEGRAQKKGDAESGSGGGGGRGVAGSVVGGVAGNANTPARVFAPSPPSPMAQNQAVNQVQNTLQDSKQQAPQELRQRGQSADALRLDIAPPAAKSAPAPAQPSTITSAGSAPAAFGNPQALLVTPEKQMAKRAANIAKNKEGPGAISIKGKIEKDKLMLSIDGGQTWTTVETPEVAVTFKFTDLLNGEIVTRSLTTYRTHDGGKTWEKK